MTTKKKMMQPHPRAFSGRAERLENPGREAIQCAIQMMEAPGAPSFSTKREKRLETVVLARALARSGTRRGK